MKGCENREEMMAKKLKCFGGCTKYGSELKAFKDRGHDVMLLGIEGDVDLKRDIRDFHTSDRFDFMFFCPPCNAFSIASGIPFKDRTPNMEIVEACLRIVDEVKPTFWIMENPRGMLRNIIGKPTITINYSDYGFSSKKPTDIWGFFPWFYPGFTKRSELCYVQNLSHDKRSIVPYGLSLSICLGLENYFKDK